MTSSREAHLVELVDETGRPTGATTVDEAHQAPGRLHRAFSVLLVAPDGRMLLQQRAAGKTRFPLRWGNSCCGHPPPGGSLTDAANLRVREELGAGPVPLTEVGVYVYRAEDPVTGRVEHEYDHVLFGRFTPGDPLRPDPTEIADLRWVDPAGLLAEIDAEPQRYAPWLGGVTERLLRHRAGDPAGPAARLDAGEPAGPATRLGSHEPAAAGSVGTGASLEEAPERSVGR
ncbi:isopentenyl-diphosphate Delta-isomerase [Micromonospora sp. NPDC049559]|uniref:isopentenyl-diphosphate Delta-isomerase n=1 Tax=Micromonospora sp. NPDC049559 TaxID=3155923 RepID=UPI003424BE43